MHVDAHEVAAAILKNVPHITSTEIHKLAICITHNNGAFRLERRRESWLVLGSILDAGKSQRRHPLIVATNLRLKPLKEDRLSTISVARTFYDELKSGIEDNVPAGYKRTWAPVAEKTWRGAIAMGGVFTQPIAKNHHRLKPERQYMWFDLAPQKDFPVGRLIYRILENGTLVGYQRVKAGLWLTFTVKRPRCPVDVQAIKHALQLTDIVPARGSLPLLWRPPRPSST